MRFKEFVGRYLVVHKCGGCGEILDYELRNDGLCQTCYGKWNIAKAESCPKCNQSAIECTCMPKGLATTGALCLRKLHFYSAKRAKEPQNRLIYFLKTNRNRRVASFVAEELSDMAMEEIGILGAEPEENAVIVSVPRGRGSRARYGFDQSALISNELSHITHIPYAGSVLGRRFSGVEQKKLDNKGRFKNVRSLFYLRDHGAVNGKYVLLFDDVVTTGASMAACVSLLKKAGAKGIICLCIAQD